MANQQQTWYPSQVQPPENPTFAQQAYPQQPTGYPQPPMGYPQPPMGYPQPPMGHPQPPMGHPQQQGCLQENTAYPQCSVNYINKLHGSSPPPVQTAVSTYGQPPVIPASYEEEEEDPKEDTAVDYSDKTSWQAFIRIVYTILMVQLAVLDGIIAVFLFVPILSRPSTHDCTFSGAILAILYFPLALCNCCCVNLKQFLPATS